VSDILKLDAAGLTADKRGRIVVDEFFRTVTRRTRCARSPASPDRHLPVLQRAHFAGSVK
jgi:hypothetical protein